MKNKDKVSMDSSSLLQCKMQLLHTKSSLFRNSPPQSYFRYSEITETFTFISYILYTNVQE